MDRFICKGWCIIDTLDELPVLCFEDVNELEVTLNWLNQIVVQLDYLEYENKILSNIY